MSANQPDHVSCGETGEWEQAMNAGTGSLLEMAALIEGDTVAFTARTMAR
ncbi:hypothetical protein [Streptomyces globisporus]